MWKKPFVPLMLQFLAAIIVLGTTGVIGRSLLAQEKRPVTVDDVIQMTRLADAAYFAGTPSKGRVAHFSPDGRQFVVLLCKGDFERNINEYSLLLFQASDALSSPKPDVLL